MEKTQKNSQLCELSKRDWLLAFGLAFFSLFVYYLTLTPSLSFLSPDGSEMATVPAILGLAHMPGYPLYTWLGFLFSKIPVGDVAHRINMMSAFMGALGVGGLYLLIAQLLPEEIQWHKNFPPSQFRGYIRRGTAALSALIFAFSQTFWSQTLIAEVYAVNIGMVALTLLALLNWERKQRARDFFLFALLFGLSTGTHISNLGFAPGFVIFILLVSWRVILNWRWWLAALSGFGLGVLQYAWLPFRAATLNDRIMLRSAPTTLEGIYSYTFGAFSNLKFAFPLAQLPDRLVLYIFMLSEEVGWIALGLGVIGFFSLLFRRTKHFYLFIGMYLFHVWFFIQYRVFDLEVFFIPSHFIFAIFIAFGLREVIALLGAAVSALFRKSFSAERRPLQRSARVALGLFIVFMLTLPGLLPMLSNWSQNDLSGDTAINDFYANVWEFLPEESVLLTQSGVFGYQAFYWQLIYDVRPDVVLPAMSNPNPHSTDLDGRAVYSTTNMGRQRGPGALPKDMVGEDAWQVPLIAGETSLNAFNARSQLYLYQITEQAPDILAKKAPEILIDKDLGPVVFLGADVGDVVESGGLLEVSLYWRIDESIPEVLRYTALPFVADEALTQVPIGKGLLQRYAQERLIKTGDVFVDHFYLVIPSTQEEGPVEFSLSILLPQGGREEFDLGTIEIENEWEMTEGWLKIAGLY